MNAAATVRLTRRFFLESLFPVVLVLVSLFVLLAVVRLLASSENEQVIVIDIPAQIHTASIDEQAAVNDEAYGFDVAHASQATSVDPRYAEAQGYIDQRQWDKAHAVYERMLAAGRDPALLNEIGSLYYKQRDYKTALKYFDEAVASNAAPLETVFNRGLTYGKQGNVQQAIREYRYVVKNNAFHFEANFNLGIAYIEAKQYDNAAQTLRQAAQLAGDERKAKALQSLGVAYKRMGAKHYTQAADAYRAALRIKPDYAAPRFGLAMLQPDTPEGWRKMLAIYDEVLRLHPGNALAWFLRGQSANQLKNKKLALESYQKAVQFDPNYDKARYNLALLYLDQDRKGDARAQFEKILEHDSDNARAHLQLGRLAHDDNSLDAALQHYKQALQHSANDYPEAYLNIGLVYKDQGNYREAIKQYKNALQGKKSYPEAWYNIGLAYSRLEDNARAVDALRKAVEEKPDYASAWYNLGIIHNKAEQIEQAIDAYQHAITIRPTYNKAQINLGILYARTGKYADAIDRYQAVLEQDTSYTKAWINLGETYLRMGRFSDAENAFSAALKLEDDNVNVLRSSAKALEGKREFDAALNRLQEAANLDAGNAEIRLHLARIYKQLGRDADARQALDHARILAPDNREIALELRAFTSHDTAKTDSP